MNEVRNCPKDAEKLMNNSVNLTAAGLQLFNPSDRLRAACSKGSSEDTG